MKSTTFRRDTDSFRDVCKTTTTEESHYNMNENNNSFDTLLSANAKIKPRNRSKSIVTKIYTKTLLKYENFNMLRTNRKLLYWTHRLVKDDDTFISFMVVLTIILVLVENEIFYEEGNKESDEVTYLRFIAIFISMTTSVWLLRRYFMALNSEILVCRYSASDSILTTGLWKYLLLELAVTCVCPYPFLNNTFTITQLGFDMEYSWDAVLTIICLQRFYMISRLFFHYSKYAKVRAEFICSLNGVKVNTSFAIKSQLQESPFTTVWMLFFTLSLICTILVRIVERPDRSFTEEYISEFDPDLTTQVSNLKQFTDNFWMVIVTSTTVGYGDLYPITHFGRGVVLSACIISSVYIGLLISATQIQISHTPKQLMVYSLLTKMQKKQDIFKEYKQFAGILLIYCIRKNDALLSKGCKSLRQVLLRQGEIYNAPESDINVARKLIDQTSDLSDFTYRLSHSKFIECTLDISKSISVFRDLLSKTGDKSRSFITVRKTVIDTTLPDVNYSPDHIAAEYKDTFRDPNYCEISSESDSDESQSQYERSSESEYKDTFRDPNYCVISSESDSDESQFQYERSSESECEEMTKNPRFMR